MKEFIGHRLKVSSVLAELQRTAPEPGQRLKDAPPYSLGRLTLVSALVLVASGVILAFLYQPTADGAAASLKRLHHPPSLAGIIHNVHRWSALLLMLLTMLHALRAWVIKAYRQPREIGWWSGVVLLLLVAGLGGTGYLLRWDIKAFALMDLVVSNLSGVPILGPLLISLILGGSGENMVPLSRGYAVHIWFLPAALALVLGLHLFAVARQGLLEKVERRTQRGPRLKRFPSVRWLPGLVFLLALLLLSILVPLDGEAIGPETIRPWPQPDWLLLFYFLPFWFFRENARVVGALIIPASVFLLLVVAPRIDHEENRRSISIALTILGLLAVGLLLGQASRLGTEVPIQGCPACHRPDILGGAPRNLAEFDIRDPDWLVFHLREPVDSILTPVESSEFDW